MADLPAAKPLSPARPGTLQRAGRVLRKDRYLYLIFLLPFLYFLVFHYLPIYGVIIAFKNYKVAFGIWGSKWVGLQYFIEFLTDPYAWKLIRNTMLLSFYSIVFGFPIPIILALLLNELQISWFKRVVQTVSYLPHFISVVVVAGMVVNFLSSDGLVNRIIVALGGESFPWLMQPRWFPGICKSLCARAKCIWTRRQPPFVSWLSRRIYCNSAKGLYAVASGCPAQRGIIIKNL